MMPDVHARTRTESLDPPIIMGTRKSERVSRLPQHLAACATIALLCALARDIVTLYGRELSMTRQELAQWKSENALQPGQTVMMKMQDWPPPERLHVGDRLFISAHVWNSSTWHIYQRGILPATLRNREPLLLAVVEKITAKRVDISIPHLHLHRGASMTMYNKPMTIQNIKLWYAEVSTRLLNQGFTQSLADPYVFMHREKTKAGKPLFNRGRAYCPSRRITTSNVDSAATGRTGTRA